MSVLKVITRRTNPKNSALPGHRAESWWSEVKAAPPDAIFGVTEAFRADKNPNKQLLGVGAYRTDDGKPWILPSVRKAEEIIFKKHMNHEYLLQCGMAEFCKLSAELMLGEESKCLLEEGRNLTCQALSGTGALRLGAAFLKSFFPGNKVVYQPLPTWGNHKNIFLHSGIEVKTYRYHDPKSIGLDFEGMCEDINKIPEKSIILFHAVAHNPTGVDPTIEQWKEISQWCLKRKLFPFIDFAYQGFASGDCDRDACALRMFLKDGHQMAIAQSYAKNMGLYGQRVGTVTIVTGSKEEATKMLSQMKLLARAMYSNPPLYGARIVREILSDEGLTCEWKKDVQTIAQRIKGARKLLVENLKKAGSQRNWDHIIRQIGMFGFTGLTKGQVEDLAKKHSVFLTADGRISMAAIGSKNVEYIANSIHDVTK